MPLVARAFVEAAERLLRVGPNVAWSFLIRTPEMVERGLLAILADRLGSARVWKGHLPLPGSTLTFNPDLVFGGGRAVGEPAPDRRPGARPGRLLAPARGRLAAMAGQRRHAPWGWRALYLALLVAGVGGSLAAGYRGDVFWLAIGRAIAIGLVSRLLGLRPPR